jgi:hypothetical protein
MAALTDLSNRALNDIHLGRHREAYALFLVGVVLVVVGFVGVLGVNILLSAILLALSFLVFHTSTESSIPGPSLDQVLNDREGYSSAARLAEVWHHR